MDGWPVPLPESATIEIRELVEREARRVAREEIASLAGLVMRRVQEEHPTRSFERNMADEAFRDRMSSIFGEVLTDFGGTPAEPGL